MGNRGSIPSAEEILEAMRSQAGPPLIPMTAKPHSGTLSEIKLLNWLEFLWGLPLAGEVFEGGMLSDHTGMDQTLPGLLGHVHVHVHVPTCA